MIATALCCALLILSGIERGRMAMSRNQYQRRVAGSRGSSELQLDRAALTRLAVEAASGSPFQLGGRDLTLSTSLGQPAEPAVLVTLPTLSLRGIVGGPPWRAVIVGLPGVNGAIVVRQGDSFPPVRIGRIDPSRVTIFASDTSWTLTLDARGGQ